MTRALAATVIVPAVASRGGLKTRPSPQYPYPGDAGRAPDREAAAWALTPVMGANLPYLDPDTPQNPG